MENGLKGLGKETEIHAQDVSSNPGNNEKNFSLRLW